MKVRSSSPHIFEPYTVDSCIDYILFSVGEKEKDFLLKRKFFFLILKYSISSVVLKIIRNALWFQGAMHIRVCVFTDAFLRLQPTHFVLIYIIKKTLMCSR